MMQKSRLRKFEESLLRGVIWGFVGGIYASLFIGFLELFQFSGFSFWSLVLAGSLAGAVGAAFYGAMQIAIMGTLAGVIATFGYLVTYSANVQPLAVWIVASVAGLSLGAVFGAMHVFLVKGALSKMLSGLVGGSFAGLVLWGVTLLLPEPLPVGVLVGLLVPITGYVYVAVSDRVESLCSGRIPDPIVGGLVAGSLAGVVGTSVWAVGGSATGSVDPAFRTAIDHALSQVPVAILGGAVGGIVAGSLLEVLGMQPKH
jgi:hypothetical protein